MKKKKRRNPKEMNETANAWAHANTANNRSFKMHEIEIGDDHNGATGVREKNFWVNKLVLSYISLQFAHCAVFCLLPATRARTTQ